MGRLTHRLAAALFSHGAHACSVPLRRAAQSFTAPLTAAASGFMDAFSPPAPPCAPAVAGIASVEGGTPQLQRRSACGVETLEGVAEDDETDTLSRLRGAWRGGGLREIVTGLPSLPGLAHRGGWLESASPAARDCHAAATSNAAALAEEEAQSGLAHSLGERLAQGVEGLRALLSDGIWFAVPKRKVRVQMGRVPCRACVMTPCSLTFAPREAPAHVRADPHAPLSADLVPPQAPAAAEPPLCRGGQAELLSLPQV